MAVVTEKIKSVLDTLLGGFRAEGEDDFEGIANEMYGDEYIEDGNAVRAPKYSYEPTVEKYNESKVTQFPRTIGGYEVMVMEPRSFDDAATIVQHLKDRKTIVLNLHLLDKEQSQRTIDFVCGAAHALNGKPQKVGDLVFVFTPSNVTLSVEMNAVQNKFNDSLWRAPIQQ